jgi:hypothetical protein
MRATVEVYENNAGGICVAVFGQNGLTNLFVLSLLLMVMKQEGRGHFIRKRYTGSLARMNTTQKIFLVCLWMMLMQTSATAT